MQTGSETSIERWLQAAFLPLLVAVVGTALFVAAFLWLQGERRLPWLLGYSISLGFGLALFFSTMLPYPMPMLILQTAY